MLLLVALATLGHLPATAQPPAELQEPLVDATQPAVSPESSDAADPAATGDGDEGPVAPTEPVAYTKEQIDDFLQRVGDLELNEDAANQAKTYYQDALTSTSELLAAQNLAKAKAAEYAPVLDPQHPDRPAKYSPAWYQDRLSLPIDEVLGQQPQDLTAESTEALAKRATKLEERQNKWSKDVKQLEAAPTLRKRFLNNVPTRSQALERELAEAVAQRQEIVARGISNQVTEARRVALVQREAKLRAELEALKAEKAAHERAETVYQWELELSQRKADRYDELLSAVRAELAVRRRQAANKQASAAAQQAELNKQVIERNASSLGVLSEHNQTITSALRALAAELEKTPEETDATTERANAIAADYQRFQSEYGDSATLSQAGGELLRDQRANLPRLTTLKADISRRTSQRRDISFRRFAANQQLRDLEDVDSEIAKTLQQVEPQDRAAAEPVVRMLLTSKREYLRSYVENLDRLDSELGKLIGAQQQLLNNTDDFRDFIAERDLWIRSCLPLWARRTDPGGMDFAWRWAYYGPAIEAAAWGFNPKHWLGSLNDLRVSAVQQPTLSVTLTLAFALLLYLQRRARRQLRLLGEEAAKKTCTDIKHSLRALWLTLLISLPWPLLLLGVGWLLNHPAVNSEFTRSLSQSTRATAWLLLLTEFLRQTCRGGGLAEAHLAWPRAELLQARRYLRWAPVLAPLVLWFVGLDVQTTQPLWSASLGRVLFLIALVAVTFALWRIFMTESSAIYVALTRDGDDWLHRLNRLWRPAVVAAPAALGALALMGYYYTALQLSHNALATSAMLLGLLITGGLLRRWVLLNRRSLAREQARQRRAQAQTAAEAGDGAAALLDVPEEVVDLTALSEHTRKLLRVLLTVTGVVGVILIWQEVFPALAWLDENALPWASGDNPSTWGDLLKCLVAAVITYVAVRDLPSLLELVVLQRLPMDQGARYAIATLARYALLAVGVMISAGLLGLTGSNISWLVAAMGVGLGFGLQEIFANFVSGVILLFERPIRIGDIITLGDTTGVVNRIRMRATTIVDWDRKEYVVPNKDLMTERLLNWTLSDQTNRIVIPVGVAYGADTDRACELLRQVVAEHPLILDDPPPLFTFESFGDSTLNLTIRCYLPNLDNRLQTIHELNTRIHTTLNAAGIEIAFPQRDLHVRSLPPGWERFAAAIDTGAQGDSRPAESDETSTQ